VTSLELSYALSQNLGIGTVKLMSLLSPLCGNFNRGAYVRLRRSLRRRAHAADEFLWSELRARQFLKFKFRRMHSIGFSIVNFYCVAARLAILVVDDEGENHLTNLATSDSSSLPGLRVLTFSESDVLERTDDVMSRIAAAIHGLDPYFGRSTIRFNGIKFRKVSDLRLRDLPAGAPTP